MTQLRREEFSNPLGGSRDSRVDPRKVDIEDINRKVNGKLEKSPIVSHTFTTVTEESFEHRFGKIPRGAIIISQSENGSIKYNKPSWTEKRVFMTSSVINNQAEFLFL